MTQGGKTHIRQEGFTITEVLIVLAVTGFLFFTAFIYINGRQNRTEFQVGIRQVQQQFQQVINEVASGYYPDTGAFSCNPTPTPIVIATPGGTQGTNVNCIFVGKVLTVGSSRQNNVGVFSLAGARVDGNGRDVSTLIDAKPVAIARGTSVNTSAPTSVTQQFTLPNSIKFHHASVVRTDNSTANLAAGVTGGLGVAVVSSLADFTNTGVTSQNSATQTLGLYYLQSGWGAAVSPETEADAINAEVTSGIADKWQYRLKQAQYCFSSGTTNQSGLVTVGSSGNGLTVTLDLKNGTGC